MKEETKEFTQDIVYREQLLKNAGLNPLNQHKIRSIIGPQEITKIIKDFVICERSSSTYLIIIVEVFLKVNY